jgi:hypothetical protein
MLSCREAGTLIGMWMIMTIRLDGVLQSREWSSRGAQP